MLERQVKGAAAAHEEAEFRSRESSTLCFDCWNDVCLGDYNPAMLLVGAADCARGGMR